METLDTSIKNAIENMTNDEITNFYSHLKEGEPISSNSVSNLVAKLSESDIKIILTPIATKIVSDTFAAVEDGEDNPLPPIRIARRDISAEEMENLLSNMGYFYLHANAYIECYYFHSIYTYEAFTTKDANGKKKKPVDRIHFKIRKNVTYDNYEKSKNNTDSFKFVDKVSGGLNTCGETKLTVTAIVNRDDTKKIKGHKVTEVIYAHP